MFKIKRYLESNTLLKIFADGLFIIAIIASLTTLVLTYMDRRSLPVGVCPINTRVELYYASILLLILSFIVSFYEKRKNHK